MLTKVLVPGEGMAVGTAMLMYTGVGAASVVVPLVLIGLCLLIMTRFKKRDESYWPEKTGDDAVQYTHAVCCSSHSLYVRDPYF